MDYDNLRSVLDIFWSYTTIFIAVSVLNAVVCAVYLICCCKFSHIRAKDPSNLLLIYIAGQCQSWGHYFYSLPIYEDQVGNVTTCLFVGYILQHFLGTSLLFYALISRLVKYGAVFDAFESCHCCGKSRGIDSDWNLMGYTVAFRKRYKILMAFTLIFLILPMMAFVISVYTEGAISIDSKSYCTTALDWKIAFMCVTIFYFLILAFMLCFVPKFIKVQYYNESSALTQAILYSAVVFCIEVWISFNIEYGSFEWVMISNGIMFSIHTFVIFRIFFYRFFKACRRDMSYELDFIQSHTPNPDDDNYYIRIVTNCSHNNKHTMGFLDHVKKFYPHEAITITSPTNETLSKEIQVSLLISFLKRSMCLMDQIEESEKSLRGQATCTDYQFNEFRHLCSAFVENNMIVLTEHEGKSFLEETKFTLNKFTMKRLIQHLMFKLFTVYFSRYSRSDDFCKVFENTRKKVEFFKKTQLVFDVDSERERNTGFQNIQLVED